MTPRVVGQIKLFNPFNHRDPGTLKILEDGQVSFEVPENLARKLWHIAACDHIDYAKFLRRLVDSLIEDSAERETAKRNIVKFPVLASDK